MKLKPGVQVVATDVATIVINDVMFDDENRTIMWPDFNDDARTINICWEMIEDEKEYFKRKLMGK